MANKYSASEIEVLEGLEPVRRRPGMYIGGTEGPQGLHHLVKEIVDNAIDEAMNGYANRVVVTLHKEGDTVTVEDNGRGIPVDIHPKFKKPALEILLTTLHSGGKFSADAYQTAGGLHGVGSSVVNALSRRLDVWVERDGGEFHQAFEQGKPVTKLKRLGSSKGHGTKVTFSPDPEIFRETTFSTDRIRTFVREKAFLNRGLTLIFRDEASGSEEKFCFEDGVTAFLKAELEREQAQPIGGEIFSLERANGMKIEVAFAWTEATSERVRSYVNGIPTANGGTHEDGFRGGIVKAVRNHLTVHDLIPKGVKVIAEDIREGLVAVLAVQIPGSVAQLQFQGQTKDRLNNPEVTAPVETLVKSFENILNEKPKVAATLIERVLLAAKARAASRAAAESVTRKLGVSHRLNLPGKLADCSATNPAKSELFIVEGDSAGGTAKQARDRETQAILPLKGKILNSVAASDAKLKENQQLLDLISALGCGVGESLRIERLRYHSVVILTDADADGMHIATLLMAFFFNYMKPLIAGGHLYLGMPPLYRVKIGAGAKQVDKWAYSDQEKDKILAAHTKNKVQVTRFKGLGEMNSETLWDTTLDPERRTLLQVRIDDEAEVRATFERLLGKEVAPRYELIKAEAHRVEIDL